MNERNSPQNRSNNGPTDPQTTPTSADLIADIVKQVSKLNHDLSQPLTFMLTALEMGTMADGVDQEECKLLLEAALQMRDQLRLFRDFLRNIEAD